MGSILFNVRSSIQFGLGVEINEFLVEQSELISQHLDSKEKLKFLNIPFEELKKHEYSFDAILSLANHSTYDGNTKQSLDSYFDKIYELLSDNGQLIFESHPPELEPPEALKRTVSLMQEYFSIEEVHAEGLNGFLDKNRTYYVCTKRPK